MWYVQVVLAGERENVQLLDLMSCRITATQVCQLLQHVQAFGHDITFTQAHPQHIAMLCSAGRFICMGSVDGEVLYCSASYAFV